METARERIETFQKSVPQLVFIGKSNIQDKAQKTLVNFEKCFAHSIVSATIMRLSPLTFALMGTANVGMHVDFDSKGNHTAPPPPLRRGAKARS